jgi:hypothetical protein
VDAPEYARNAVIEREKYKRFSGRGSPDPPIFFTNHLRAGVMEQKVKYE